MARALSLPAARAAPNLTLLVWGGITVLGSLLLPWFREGRDLFVAYLLGGGRPFSGGPLVAILGFISVLGTGLALSGILHADAFLAASIVWVAAFVLVFILFPLWAVLKASGGVQFSATVSQVTLDVVRVALELPFCFLQNNPGAPRYETALAVAW